MHHAASRLRGRADADAAGNSYGVRDASLLEGMAGCAGMSGARRGGSGFMAGRAILLEELRRVGIFRGANYRRRDQKRE